MKKIVATALSVITVSACVPSPPGPYEDRNCADGTSLFVDWDNKTVKHGSRIYDARFSMKDRTVEWERWDTRHKLTNFTNERKFWDGKDYIDCGPRRK